MLGLKGAVRRQAPLAKACGMESLSLMLGLLMLMLLNICCSSAELPLVVASLNDSSTFTSVIDYLVANNGSLTYNLDASNGSVTYNASRNISIIGSSGASFDLEYNSWPPITVSAGLSFGFFNMTITNTALSAVPAPPILNSTSVKVASPSIAKSLSFLQFPGLTLVNGSMLFLDGVHIVSDCSSLANYYNYLCGGGWDSGIQTNHTHINVTSWVSSTVVARNVILSCSNQTFDMPSACHIQPVATEEDYRVALALPQLPVLVIILMRNITLANSSLWSSPSTPIVATGIIIMQGTPGVQLDIQYRMEVFAIRYINTVIIFKDLLLVGLPLGPPVPTPPNTPPWAFTVALWFVDIKQNISYAGPYIGQYNVGYRVATDFTNLMYKYVSYLSSPSPQLRASVAFMAFLVKSDLSQSSQGLNANATGPRSFTKNVRGVPDDNLFAGVSDVSMGDEIPMTQWLPVTNGSYLLSMIRTGCWRPDYVPPKFSLVLLNNISLHGMHDVAPYYNGTLPAKYFMNSSLPSWAVLNRSVVISRWRRRPTAIDFGWSVDLFGVVGANTAVRLVNLVLLNLPSSYSAASSRLFMWGSALLPFTYNRAAPSTLVVYNCTLVVSQDELDFMYTLQLHQNGSMDKMSQDAIPKLDDSYTTVYQDDQRLVAIRANHLDGFGYESANLTITSIPPFTLGTEDNTSTIQPPPPVNISLFENVYLGSSGDGDNTNDGGGDNLVGWEIAVIVVCIALGLLLLATLVAVFIVVRRARPQKMKLTLNKQSSDKLNTGSICRAPEIDMALDSNMDIPRAAYNLTQQDGLGVAAAMVAVRAQVQDPDLTIKERLGKGGSAEVYLGAWRGMDVAVKVILLQDARSRQTATQEAGILLNMAHPNIVACYHFFVQGLVFRYNSGVMPPGSACGSMGPNSESKLMAENSKSTYPCSSNEGGSGAPARDWALFLVQEFCSRGTLASKIDAGELKVRDDKDTDRLAMVLALALDVAKAMAHVHSKKIIHGDLKPSNVLLQATSSTADSAAKRPFVGKVSDFGLSLHLEGSCTHMSGVDQGTLFYAPPELIMEGRLSMAADVYAFGAILWELYHGIPPWRTRRLVGTLHSLQVLEFATFCPPPLVDLVRVCMAKDPEDRPTFEEIIVIMDLFRKSRASLCINDSPCGSGSSPCLGPAAGGAQTLNVDSSSVLFGLKSFIRNLEPVQISFGLKSYIRNLESDQSSFGLTSYTHKLESGQSSLGFTSYIHKLESEQNSFGLTSFIRKLESEQSSGVQQ